MIKDYPNGEREIYFVIKPELAVWHGPYKRLTYEDVIFIEGEYTHGLRTGKWTVYDQTGKVNITKGFYEKDKPIGLWNFYDEDGVVEQVYDYSKNKLIYYKPENKREYKVINIRDTSTLTLERPPLYFGGSAALMRVLHDHLKFPPQAIDVEISGKVIIGFTIDSNGFTSAHHVVQGLLPVFDSAAFYAIKTIPDNWFPGMQNGKPVNVKYLIPVKYT